MNRSVFMDMQEVKEILGISKNSAYQLIQQLNEQMQAEGFLALRGRVNRKYFEDRLYLRNSITEKCTQTQKRTQKNV